MKKFLIALLVLVVVLSLAVNFYMGSIVKTAVEKFGPAAMHVPVTLEKAEFRLMRGHITLKGFTLGNPKGYSEGDAITVGEIIVDFVPRSLFRDTIVVNRIYVDAPDINYEFGLGTSNIGEILDGLSKKDKDRKDEKKEEKEDGKKVAIEDILIENGKVKIAAKLTGGYGAPITLPTIHLTDIGKEEGGASMTEVIGYVFKAILSSVGSVVEGAGKLVGKGVEGAGKVVGEGAEAVGGAAVDGVKAVGNAAEKAAEGIGNLFGREKKE